MNLEIKVANSQEEIDDAKSVRITVFQEEQGIDKESDFDGKDDEALHFVVYDGKAIGAARVRFPENKRRAKIERVAVVSDHRGKGIGKQIMNAIATHLTNLETEEIYLDSQAHAKGFYEGLGYIQEGEVFEEVGIPHVVMVRRLK